jgi:hypothetical protein
MAKEKEFSYLSADEFTIIEGTLIGFRKNSYGLSAIVETKDKNVGIGLNSVLTSLFKQANENDVLADGVKVKLVKGEKAQGKKYFLSELYIDGERIIEKSVYSPNEFDELFD